MARKVLIVDDSKLARMSVVKVLKGLHPDWVVAEAGDATQALEAVRNGSPDFALLDFNMPGKDGLTLAVEIGGLNLPIDVAVISANHQTEVVERVQAAGATFIRKPLTEAALIEFLKERSDRGRSVQ